MNAIDNYREAMNIPPTSIDVRVTVTDIHPISMGIRRVVMGTTPNSINVHGEVTGISPSSMDVRDAAMDTTPM
jgi:hypothetical protein